MQKLKNSVIDRMLQERLKKAEIDFLIEISHYQDDSGRIYGVYYKDICAATGISYETFYTSLHSLEERGFVKTEKNYYGDWDITILDNDFSYPDAVKEGYISTGHDIFYNTAFRKLKAGEKLLALQFLKIAGAGKRYHIGVQLLYEKYCKLLGITKRTLQVYLGTLKSFFSIGIKSKMYWITPLVAVFKNAAPRDAQNFAGHIGRVACRRNRASYTQDSWRDTTELIRQYAQQLQGVVAEVFMRAVSTSIERINESVGDKRKWNRQLNPKFIHKIIRESI